MTSTEEELRAALTLLEQRAPLIAPDTVLIRAAGAPHRPGPRRWLPPLIATVLVIVIVIVVIATRQPASRSPAAHPVTTTPPTANPNATTCLEQPGPRPGANSTLVPGSPTSLTICQYPAGRPSKSTTTDTKALVAALNALSTTRMPANHGCRARFPGALPAQGTYELHFHYATGPDVVINVIPECRPSINNSTSLEADDAVTIVTILQQLVPPQLNVQYDALAINTSCVGPHCVKVRGPAALASLVHATACNAWQLNRGSHGGPHYLVKLLVPAGDADHDRNLITHLPGVLSVNAVPARDLEKSPHADPNFPRPTPFQCD